MKSLGNLLCTVHSYRLDGWYSIPGRSVGNILFPPARAQRLSGLFSYLHNPGKWDAVCLGMNMTKA